MSKKSQAVQLQVEVNNDDDWDKLLEKKSILTDIYSEWAGHCAAMIPLLRKIKLEIAGDTIQYAVAKADTVSALNRFKNTSEPTWMFIADGQMVNFMYGANSPKLERMLISELKKQEEIRSGSREREGRDISEMADEEKERFEISAAIIREAQRIKEEKRLEELDEKRIADANAALENIPLRAVILVFSHAIPAALELLKEQFSNNELRITDQQHITFTAESLGELLYFTAPSAVQDEQEDANKDLDTNENRDSYKDVDEVLHVINSIFDEDAVNYLNTEKNLALLIKPASEDIEYDLDDKIREILYGDVKLPPGDPESLAVQLTSWKVREIVKKEGEEEEEIVEEFDITAMLIEATPEEPNEGDEGTEEEEVEEEQGEMYSIPGLWTPPDPLTKGLAIKIMFPVEYEPFAIPDKVPIPPHYTVAFDIFKRRQVLELIKEFHEDVLRYGFFTSDHADTAKLIAKSDHSYVEMLAQPDYKAGGEKMVLQLSKVRSVAVLPFVELGPSYMSPNTVQGERECKLFFPEDYDESLEEVEEEENLEDAGDGEAKQSERAEDEEDEGLADNPDEADKATSPMPPEN